MVKSTILDLKKIIKEWNIFILIGDRNWKLIKIETDFLNVSQYFYHNELKNNSIFVHMHMQKI